MQNKVVHLQNAFSNVVESPKETSLPADASDVESAPNEFSSADADASKTQDESELERLEPSAPVAEGKFPRKTFNFSCSSLLKISFGFLLFYCGNRVSFIIYITFIMYQEFEEFKKKLKKISLNVFVRFVFWM